MNNMPYFDNSLESCEAVMIGLGTRRFVIVRQGQPTGLRVCNSNCQRARDLRPGDEVIYQGEQTVVRSLRVYE